MNAGPDLHTSLGCVLTDPEHERACIPSLAKYNRDPLDQPDAWPELRQVIEQSIKGQPRSQQKRIGPSEIGNPCDRCLMHKMIGTPEHEEHAAWLPYVGTAVHAELEDAFRKANPPGGPIRWLTEFTVCVGQIGGVDITGHADLFDLATGTVVDWKITGATTLKKARSGPGPTYRAQAHLYGRGFALRGLKVNRVRINFLPRNSLHLGNAISWSEPYDESIALAALDRANGLKAVIDALGPEVALSVTPPHLGTEFSCGKFGDQPARSTAPALSLA